MSADHLATQISFKLCGDIAGVIPPLLLNYNPSTMQFKDLYSRKAKFPALILLVLLLSNVTLPGQQRQSQDGDRAPMNIGRFYGKVVDDSGKGIGYATIQLFGKRFDRETKELKESLIAGQITEENGDFSLEELPIRGDFTLKISVLGYTTIEKQVTFGIPMGRPGGEGQARPGGNRQGGERARPGGSRSGGPGQGANLDKDLGNIVLSVEAQNLEEVVVRGEAANVQLALDRKIFRVDKDASAAGGTAIEALQNVPSLNIDIDGNLTLRNASPQLFVDGRPTTLTLDQIAADEIESVEVITNPSAKYDASGGQAGIVNIVLKKDRRLGYNGSVRAGFDSQGGANLGGNLNVKEGKVNGFLNGYFNSRQRNGTNGTTRQNLFGDPLTNIRQEGDNDGGGLFAIARGGVDWFVNNRNTLTFEGSFRRGRFDSNDLLTTITDSLYSNGIRSSEAIRNSMRERNFRAVGGSVLYKYLFPKEGKELTADISINRFKMDNESDINTNFVNSGFNSMERQEGGGTTTYITLQTDFVEPIGDRGKVELGARAVIRQFVNSNASFFLDPTDNRYVRVPNFADEYEFTDDIFAAYGTFSQEFDNWGYQVGLRAESSRYTGTLPESQTSFENDYPLSLFPSAFITRKLNENDNIQLSYTRRINRPSFFNLIPFTDFTDSLNLRRGNPDLLPEFTNSLELTYHNIFDKGDNLLISAYFKQATDLITTFQEIERDAASGRDVIVQTYENSNSSEAYGVEFTLRNTIVKNVTLTSNLNLYNSRVDASNIESGLINDQFTWFLKENLNIVLPKLFTLQINGQYQSRAAFSPSSGSGRFHGWRRSTNTAQGYTLANWYVDVSIRKNLFNRKASLTVSMRDIFRSRKTGTFTESQFFIQDSWRLRQPQVVSVNFSYRFGKPDVSLFKRKNTKVNDAGSELMN